MKRFFTSLNKSEIKIPKLQTQLFIDGKFTNSNSGKTFDVINPTTEELICKVQEADVSDIDLAVKSSRKAFDSGPWPKMSGTQRGNLLYKLADLLEKNSDEFALYETLNNGKPYHMAKKADLPLSINCLRYYAGFADKIYGHTIPIHGPYFCYTRHEPVGVCAQIIPWNFPLILMVLKIAPALATGCTAIVKPAEQTPLSALRLGELIMEAGFPKGVVNVLPGFGPSTGAPLAAHHLVDKVAFTGSCEVGHEIMKNSHDINIKRVSLELGGKSPNIIMDDANVDLAIKQSQMGLFFNMGQSCIAGSRVFVHEKIYDEFLEKSIIATKKLKIGNPINKETDQGPLVNLDQKNKYNYYINKGKEEGAKLSLGGKEIKGKGYFVEPTIFSDVKDEMAIAKEEIFGPVMSILKFKSVEEVIKRANSSSFGLGAGVVTSSIENALKISNELKAGTVYVNCYNVFDTSSPFGGYKESGIGRELGPYALNLYTEVKTVIMKNDSLIF